MVNYMILKSTLYSKIFIQELLTSDDIVNDIRNNLDELLEIIPELKDMIGFDHKHPHHHLDVFEHTLLALSKSEIDFETRLVLLLHDIGKPHCYQEKDGIRNFKGHPKVSRDISINILKRLNYNEGFIKEVCYLIEKHDDIITSDEIKSNYDLAYKRYLIQECDALAHHPEKLEKRIKYLEKKKIEFEVAQIK